MAKRETTRWRYIYNGAEGTYIKIGRVFNARVVPEDIIRYKFNSGTPGGSDDSYVTVDEATALVAGLSLVLADVLGNDSSHVRERYR